MANCQLQTAQAAGPKAPNPVICILRFALCILLLAWAVGVSPARAQEMVGVGIDEKLGATLPLDASFTDHEGRRVQLADYFRDGRPVVLNLVYYRCAGVCTSTLMGVAQAIEQTQLPLAQQYRVLSISFDPRETHELAAAKRRSYLEAMGGPEGAEGWVFLTGDASSIARLTQAVGFRYVYVDDKGEYAHDAAAIICTADGRVSRYLRGAFYDPTTFRLSLVEASNGKVGSLSDKVWVKVCGYDPRLGKYVLMAQTVLMIGGGLTVAALAAVIGLLLYRESQRKRDMQPHAV